MSNAIERMLPLYEAKMIHHYDHRWATFERDGSVRDVTLDEKQDPAFVPMPRYWVRESVVNDNLTELRPNEWLVGVRDITNSTNERTVISALFPYAAVGNNLPIILDSVAPRCLVAVLSSLALDFVARPKVGGVHLNFFIANQLAVLPPEAFGGVCTWAIGSLEAWIGRRVDFLTGPDWEVKHRELARVELDAAMFHLYGIGPEDVEYIMETFPIVKRQDVAAYGEYGTKRVILGIYDQMAEAMAGGAPYVSAFDRAPVSDQGATVSAEGGNGGHV